MSTRQILVTAALPYANGHLHVGHMLEHIQTDIWARFQRLRGHEVLAVCADDTHGTATMIRARQEGRPAEEILAEMQAAHQRDLEGFGVHYDQWDESGPAGGDRDRWIIRSGIDQRLLPYLTGSLLYQYEEYDADNSIGYDEHLYMLTLRYLF